MMGGLPMPEMRAMLAQGGIALVFIETGVDIEPTRQVARSTCSQLIEALGVEGVHVSRSATAGLAAVAICRSAAIGVDVEQVRSGFVDEALCGLALHPAERAALRGRGDDPFFGVWVRKEAVLKALGVGLAVPPSMVFVGAGDTGWAKCGVPAMGTVNVRSLAMPKGSHAALACMGNGCESRCWTWRAEGELCVMALPRASLQPLAL